MVALLSALRDRTRNWNFAGGLGKAVMERRVTFTWNRNATQAASRRAAIGNTGKARREAAALRPVAVGLLSIRNRFFRIRLSISQLKIYLSRFKTADRCAKHGNSHPRAFYPGSRTPVPRGAALRSPRGALLLPEPGAARHPQHPCSMAARAEPPARSLRGAFHTPRSCFCPQSRRHHHHLNSARSL